MHYMLVTSITLPLQAASNGRNYMHYMAHYMLSKMLMSLGFEFHIQVDFGFNDLFSHNFSFLHHNSEETSWFSLMRHEKLRLLT